MKLFGVTDTGCYRKDNQDSCVFRELGDQIALLVVCDGMGGAQAGSVASSLAVETFAAAVEEQFAAGAPEDDPGWWDDILATACDRANRQVYELSLTKPEYEGMGTTLVAALALPGVSHVVNVGDSRCYLIEHEMIRQVTVDHSLVQLLVDRGEITAEEARVHPRKNLITRALGVDSEVDCDLLRIETGPGSRLLLCSDGLTNVLTDQVLLQTSVDETEPEGLCRNLLRMTLERGAPDNVTVVLAQL